MTTTTAIESALRVLLHIRNVRSEQRSAVRELIRFDLALLRSARSAEFRGTVWGHRHDAFRRPARDALADYRARARPAEHWRGL